MKIWVERRCGAHLPPTRHRFLCPFVEGARWAGQREIKGAASRLSDYRGNCYLKAPSGGLSARQPVIYTFSLRRNITAGTTVTSDCIILKFEGGESPASEAIRRSQVRLKSSRALAGSSALSLAVYIATSMNIASQGNMTSFCRSIDLVEYKKASKLEASGTARHFRIGSVGIRHLRRGFYQKKPKTARHFRIGSATPPNRKLSLILDR